MRRRRAKKRSDRRYFSRTAMKTNRRNTNSTVKRGGYRL